MFVPSSEVWKLALAFALGAAILMGAWGAAPRRSVPRADLRRLVAVAVPALDQRVLVKNKRPGTNQAHLAAQDVDELW